jgi:16S rRNA processing protein RimM
MSNRKLCVGVITAPRGVRGQVRVKSFTAEPDDIVRYAPLTNADGSNEYRLEVVGHAKGVLLARVEGIKNREAAEALRGVELFVDRDVLPDAEDEDDFYYADLIGLTAVLPDGGVYGTVKALHDFGAGDMIELSLNVSGNIILPFTKAVVPEVDMANGRIVVDPPEMFGDPEPVQPDESTLLNQNGEEDAK